MQEALIGPVVSGIDSYARTGGLIPPIVNTHHRPLQQLATPPVLPAAVGAPRRLFGKDPQPPGTREKYTPPPPAALRSATCSVNHSRQLRIRSTFSSAARPCRQGESNRRLHGTSPVTQPLTQHPPQHVTYTQPRTAPDTSTQIIPLAVVAVDGTGYKHEHSTHKTLGL